MDLETPVSAFFKLQPLEPIFLLESVEGGELIGRYSFIGLKALYKIIITPQSISIINDKTTEVRKFKGDPFKELKKISEEIQAKFYTPETDDIDEMPRLKSGMVGYCSYDIIRFIEKLPDLSVDKKKLPLAILVVPEVIIAFDHVQKDIKLITALSASDSMALLNEIKSLFRKNINIISNGSYTKPIANHSREKFSTMVNKAKEYIFNGDAYQIVLSVKFEGHADVEPFQVYRGLRMINPSPYMYFLNFDEIKIVGSSPEVLVRVEKNEVLERPIAGTRQRGKNKEQDLALEKELLMSEKDKAEHIMLVDLARNDIGRIAIPTTEKVVELMKVERYSHVMHLVSIVSGQLRNGLDIYDVFRATFPAGTVSGAPKIRAMQIIEELEEEKRGPYAGSVGYFAFDNTMDQAINIRSITFHNDEYIIQAGAGILADSEPDKEYEEITNKAKALFSALELTKEF